MTPARFIATWFGVGLLRPAPGTWASAVAVMLGVLIHRLGHFPLLAAATVAVTILGFWSVEAASRGDAHKDRSEFVIDEVAGQWLALSFASAGFWFAGAPSTMFPWPAPVAAFLFFRLFDIWKPWWVGRLDRRTDAAGVMLDDLAAGALAGVCTILAAAIAHGVFLR
ncbi:phosphatidylglycerophosphatase A [Paracoccus pacificus]|uniref:Phosphatidylglycerophosphatase A n=1 Tax=Paracoccus pacificus TaxID=1463598 RepID=A0ABW4RCY0_9RHOB